MIVAFGAQLPAWEHLPVYALAFGAQVGVDACIYIARIHLSLGVPVRKLLSELGLSERVDLLLTPLGLLAAIAAADTPAGALLIVALFPLLIGFEREREGRIERSLELSRAYRGTALLLRDLLEDDDEYTGHHTEDVVQLSVQVAENMGVDEDTLRATEMGALLHDIGKISVPDEIINKPGKLNDEEWAIMRQHTVEGERMLQQVGGLLSSVGVVVRASHERWDGGGYPDGLVGEAIPVPARIVSACDAFNAMTTDRSYRKALPLEVAIARAGEELRYAVRTRCGHRAGRRGHGWAGARLAAGDRAGAGGHSRAARGGARERFARRVAQLSNPRPSRSSSRSHGPRRPPLASARTSARCVARITAQRAGSGGNGSGRLRTSFSRVRSVSVPSSRSSATRAPNRLAPTPEPGVADRVHRAAAERAAERHAEAAAGVDRAAPRVRDRDRPRAPGRSAAGAAAAARTSPGGG